MLSKPDISHCGPGTDRNASDDAAKFGSVTSDTVLWNSFREGDEGALEMIFERFAGPMYNYGMKILNDEDAIKDIIQELFIELWRRRMNLGETSFIKFYLFKSLRRKIIKVKVRIEKKIFTRLDTNYDLEVTPSQEFVIVSEQQLQDEKESLLRLLGQLTRRQREAIFLRYYDELDYEQIAGIMGVNKQSAYNLIHDAIAQLRKLS